jgi:hypothetical protein
MEVLVWAGVVWAGVVRPGAGMCPCGILCAGGEMVRTLPACAVVCTSGEACKGLGLLVVLLVPARQPDAKGRERLMRDVHVILL